MVSVIDSLQTRGCIKWEPINAAQVLRSLIVVIAYASLSDLQHSFLELLQIMTPNFVLYEAISTLNTCSVSTVS